MSFKKNLEPSDISLSSFQVHKKFSFTDTDSGSGVFSVPIIKGSDSNLYDFSTSTASTKTISGSVFYKVPNYHMINTLYYKDVRNMRGYIDYIRGVPTSSNAINEYISINHLQTPSSSVKLRRPYTRQLHSTATVISLPQKFYGEYIKPGSFEMIDESLATTFVLRDDGRGNIYDTAFSSSYANRTPTTTNSGSVVGNIFYSDGLIVITDTGSYSTVGTLEGSDGFTVNFRASQTIYEREYTCPAGENEFQFTNNKSARVGRSGSISIPAFPITQYTNTIDDNFIYDGLGYATGSFDSVGYNMGTEFLGVTTHSEFATYVTAIGLYNDENELLAVGKPAMPIKNEKELSLTFVVRFDTN
jgi:hypothetical protein